MGKAYTEYKVFDCQDMPDDIRKVFFDNERSGNDCYVKHYVFDERCCIGIEEGTNKPSWLKEFDTVEPENIMGHHVENGLIWVYDKSLDVVSSWLFENGAFIGEEVLINHNW